MIKDKDEPPPNLMTGDFKPAAQVNTRNKRFLERRNTGELKLRRNLENKDNKNSNYNVTDTTDKLNFGQQNTQRDNKYGYSK